VALQTDEVWTCRLVLIGPDGDYGDDVLGVGATKIDAFFDALDNYVSAMEGVEFADVT